MTRVLASVILLAVAACSSDGSPGSSPDDDGSGDTPDSGDDTAATCTGKAAQPLDATWELTWEGVTRTFAVHVPASYDPIRRTPLILNFHGYSSYSWQQELFSKMTEKSDAEGFIVVYPQGTGSTPGWNAGACCGDAATSGVDDVGFVGAMLDRLEADLCIDSHRVFSTGMSNGGFLSHRLACEMADRIAAVAPVAGVLGIPDCAPSRPIAVMHFHGTADTVIPYDGDPSSGFAPVVETWEGWTARDQCTDAATVSFEMGDSRCEAHSACEGGVETILCTVENGGHTWPGGLAVPALGYTTTDLSATDAMWEFFQRHPLP